MEIKQVKNPKTFTLEEIEEAREEYLGFCISCGATRDSCEPDAREYPCEECSLDTVFGAEEILIEGLVREDSSE